MSLESQIEAGLNAIGMPGHERAARNLAMILAYAIELNKDPAQKLNHMRRLLMDLHIEINCRREHGADGADHLKYVEDRLLAIVNGNT